MLGFEQVCSREGVRGKFRSGWRCREERRGHNSQNITNIDPWLYLWCVLTALVWLVSQSCQQHSDFHKLQLFFLPMKGISFLLCQQVSVCVWVPFLFLSSHWRSAVRGRWLLQTGYFLFFWMAVQDNENEEEFLAERVAVWQPVGLWALCCLLVQQSNAGGVQHEQAGLRHFSHTW